MSLVPPAPSPFPPAAAVVPLAATDLAQVAALEEAVFPEPLSYAEVVRLWARDSTVYIGVREGDRLLAYFGFEVHGPTAHVISNATRPDARRRGLGSLVLRAGEEFARARGARWFLGEVRRSNVAQLRLLARLGWRVVGLVPRFFGNGEDAYAVWRLLP
jgi:ribosomal-protein-alanine N-acetyltransferase